jgi:hypothetical protein
MKLAALALSLALLVGCRAGGNAPESDRAAAQGNVTGAATDDAARKKFIEKTNANLRAYNQRLRVAYERGQKVCDNLRKSGMAPGDGCPRPEPKYEPMLKLELN